MNEEQLSDLFATGTAPEIDQAFVLQVAMLTARAQRRVRLLALVRRVVSALTWAMGIFVASRMLEAVFVPLFEGVPEFMGVPVPMVVLATLLAGLMRYVRHPVFPGSVSGASSREAI
jgi:hypothetical protein